MKKIFVIGAGGHGKEILMLIQQIGGYDILGFIDVEARPNVKVGKQDYPVFPESHLDALPEKPMLAIGVGSPAIVKKIATRFRDNFEFPNLIHPSVIANFEDIAIGMGNVITANCVLTTAIEIGSFNLFNLGCTIAHDTIIGSYNVINAMVNISGGVKIGDTNLIGVDATILQYLNIGNRSIIGASSLVTKDIADDVMAIGAPATVKKYLMNE